MIIKYNPFPAVRVNWKYWRFSPRAKTYHNKMNELRNEIWNVEEIIQTLINWNYQIIFKIEMPKSWSKKKKLEYNKTYHTQKPDIDNLYKAFVDTVFYWIEWVNDSFIYKINAQKIWSYEWEIDFITT